MSPSSSQVDPALAGSWLSAEPNQLVWAEAPAGRAAAASERAATAGGDTAGGEHDGVSWRDGVGLLETDSVTRPTRPRRPRCGPDHPSAQNTGGEAAGDGPV